jgi:hypothetical protein
MSSVHRRTISRGRKIAVGAFLAVAILLVFSLIWVTSRALLARDELLGAIPIANRVGAQIVTEGGSIDDDLRDLQDRAASAASLTSDSIWRAGELIPVLGSNLTAFREAASMIHRLAEDAIPPLADLAGTINVDSLAPSGGAFDLTTFSDAQPMLARARAALDAADQRATAIDVSNTVPQIGVAVDQVSSLVSDAKTAVDGIETAATLLPAMLGGDAPRSYLLLSLNNAELRATGGLPGAIAVLNAEGGRLSLGDLSTASTLGEFDSPVLELTQSERALYGDVLGTYMHDVTYTPDFSRSGALAQAMWLERTGETVDGVLAVDPVALSYILSATGPVDSGSGIVLTSENAVDVLVNGVYTTFDGPVEQDAFFAGVTAKIFGAVVSGQADGSELIAALTRSADENRLHLWSADETEQEKIATTPLAGVVPTSTDERTAFGVYFNDATGAKMDYYLSSAIGIASGVCRNDGRPNFEVTVKLESRAPVDSGTSLPGYITGGGAFGVTPGNVRTNIFVYAPEGSVPYSVTIDGQEYAFVAVDESNHSVAGVTVELAPGQQSEVQLGFVGMAGASSAVELQHTPMASDVLTSLDNFLDCSEIPSAPVDGEEGQSGASPSHDGTNLLRSKSES